MSKRGVDLHIGSLNVGSRVPIGRGTLESTVSHHLNQQLAHTDTASHPQEIHMPEIRVRAHPSLGIDALGEHVARQVLQQIKERDDA